MAFNSFNSWWALNGGRCDTIDSVRDLVENAWDAAVEKFTDAQQRKGKIFRQCGCAVCDHNSMHECLLPECAFSERKSSPVA